VKLKLKNAKPDLRMFGEICAISLPSIIMASIGSLTTYVMDLILVRFSSTAVAVYGVYFKLQSFIFMPVFGLNNGLVPIIAYNYGAGKRRRMLKALRLAIYAAVTLMLIGLLLMQIIPGPLLMLFNADEGLLRIGTPALRTISLSFVFAGFCIVVSSTFQALGKGSYSMLLSAARQLIVLLPAAYLLSLSGKVSAVWFAFPIAEIASVAVALLLFFRIYKRILSRIPDQSDA
jgi:Na+-driven multidrug efflux pump